MKAKLFVGLTLLLVGSSSIALAQAQAPKDLEIDQTKVVKVMPVWVTGTTSQITAASVGVQPSSDSSMHHFESFMPDEGLGFSGSTTSDDIRALGIGVIATTSLFESHVGLWPDLIASASHLELGEETLAALKLAQAKPEEPAGALVLEITYAARVNMSEAKPRLHGYLLAGVIVTTIYFTVKQGQLSAAQLYARSLGPLQSAFEHDAEYGGQDRKIALVLSKVREEANSEKPDPEKLLSLLVQLGE